MKHIREQCLNLRYKYYKDMATYNISNPTTQFTGSFYPVPHQYKINLLKFLPEFIPIYLGLKKNKFPKYLIYIILMFYYNYKIKDKIDRNYFFIFSPLFLNNLYSFPQSSKYIRLLFHIKFNI